MDERKPLITYEQDDDAPSKNDVKQEGNTTLSSSIGQTITFRHWLVGPVAFLFMSSYTFSYFSFAQYKYIKLQNEYFPGIKVNSTTSYCDVNESSVNFKIQQDVQQKTAEWGIYFNLSGGIASIISNFVLGSLTDRWGRKFLFIIPCFGTAFRLGYTVVGMTYNLPLWYYIFGYFVEGCTGQLFNLIQISYIYISDITRTGIQRSLGIVFVEFAIGMASTFPNLAAGYIIDATDSFLVPFNIALGILALTMLLIIVLPESFPKEMRLRRTYVSKLDNLRDSYDLFISSKNKGRRWMYNVLLVVFALGLYDVFGRISVENLYLLNYPFCWDPTKLGIFAALRSGFQQIIGMAMVKVLHFCMNDEWISVFGCVSYGSAFVLEAFATNEMMMYIGKSNLMFLLYKTYIFFQAFLWRCSYSMMVLLPKPYTSILVCLWPFISTVMAVGTLGLLTVPMTRSIMSQMTSPYKQGEHNMC